MMNSKEIKFEVGGDKKERRDSAIPKEIEVRTEAPSDPEILVRAPSDSVTERRDAAVLLLSVAAIASKEIRIGGLPWDDDEQPTLVRPKARFPRMSAFQKSRHRAKLTPRFAVAKHMANDSDEEDEMEYLELPPTDERFAWSRARAVSMDSEGNRGSPDSHRKTPFGSGNIVSPEHSPVSRRPPGSRKKGLRPKKRKRSYSVESVGSRPAKKALPNDKLAKGRPMTLIMRKKFSWKNYPELEAFLIANREEYLRHSALNYTVQQKQYNNRLTERLLELAADQGYMFDPEDFSFVTVRDRIRCYFKSYVQSAKKRGVIIGYAARKAGLLTEEDLEKSAGIAGRIVLPSTSM